MEIVDKAEISRVSILPYHSIGKHKYPKLVMIYSNDLFRTSTQDRLDIIKKIFDKKGKDYNSGGAKYNTRYTHQI